MSNLQLHDLKSVYQDKFNHRVEYARKYQVNIESAMIYVRKSTTGLDRRTMMQNLIPRPFMFYAGRIACHVYKHRSAFAVNGDLTICITSHRR